MTAHQTKALEPGAQKQMGAQTEAQLAAFGRASIDKGSKSFALASKLFGKDLQADVQMLYAWCRHCDDVIDGQDLGGDAPDAELSAEEQQRRLDALRDFTRRAFAGETLGSPPFDGFGLVARRRALPERYAMDLLDGFAMDAERRVFRTLDDTMAYCYGVAGAVGVMMAIVMGVDASDDETLDRACDLGLAFQLTNICRDVIDDAKAGRIYLPHDLLAQHGAPADAAALASGAHHGALSAAAIELLELADQYYRSASQGVRCLPPRAGAAVAAARNVYSDIGREVRARRAKAWDERIFISNRRKVLLALSGAVSGAAQSVFLSRNAMAPRGPLWRRPTGGNSEQDTGLSNAVV